MTFVPNVKKLYGFYVKLRLFWEMNKQNSKF